MKTKHTPAPLHWYDRLGRKNGEGEPIGIGRVIGGAEPEVGSCSRFSFCVVDDRGFVVANAKLFAVAPEMLELLKDLLATAEAVDAGNKATGKDYVGFSQDLFEKCHAAIKSADPD